MFLRDVKRGNRLKVKRLSQRGTLEHPGQLLFFVSPNTGFGSILHLAAALTLRRSPLKL
ncbi:hypothetical protein [Paenibacillus ihumii]|uniref:hypothetical protein n=1 Tax=Paenibacillus ihumii TaxID=687436 RepID=UPI000B304F89|nr:hypothetical protein [Paenibacillus ihumii]